MHWPVRNWDDIRLAFPFRPEAVDGCSMSEGRVTRVMIWSFSKASYCACTCEKTAENGVSGAVFRVLCTNYFQTFSPPFLSQGTYFGSSISDPRNGLLSISCWLWLTALPIYWEPTALIKHFT